MIGISSKIPRVLPAGAELVVADNTGAKTFRIITVRSFRGRRRKIPAAGVGDLIIGSAKKGKPDILHQVLKAVVIRQKKEFKRADGTRIKFSDNACVLVDDDGKPKGTEIKGPVAKEAIERWSKMASNAKIII